MSRLLSTTSTIGATAQIYAATEPSLSDRDLSKTLIGPLLPTSYASQVSEWTPLHPLFVNDASAEALWDVSAKIIKEKRSVEFYI